MMRIRFLAQHLPPLITSMFSLLGWKCCVLFTMYPQQPELCLAPFIC